MILKYKKKRKKENMTTWVENEPIKATGTAVWFCVKKKKSPFPFPHWIIQQHFFFFFSFPSIFHNKMTTLMTPAELLELNLNDSALDLLNAAIASHHQIKPEDEQDTTEDEATLLHGNKIKRKTKKEKKRV